MKKSIKLLFATLALMLGIGTAVAAVNITPEGASQANEEVHGWCPPLCD